MMTQVIKSQRKTYSDSDSVSVVPFAKYYKEYIYL